MLVRPLFKTIVLVLFLLPLTTTFVIAQSAPPVGDTYSSSGSPRTNYGTQPTLIVREGFNTYLQFNLAALPAGASVSKATLRLFVDSVPANGSFDVYPVESSWSESTLDYNNQPSLGASATGGHPIALTSSNVNDFVLIDVTTLVQEWVNQSVANNGIALVLEGYTGSFSFDSKESTATSHHAELEIAMSGPVGPQGPQGAPGAIGPQGPAGPAGATGAAGAPGAGAWTTTSSSFTQPAIGANTPSITVGNSSWMAVGQVVFVKTGGYYEVFSTSSTGVVLTNLGYAGNASAGTTIASAQALSAAGLIGATGATGTTGPAGATGPAGPTGATGATGPLGPAGPTGATGATGPGYHATSPTSITVGTGSHSFTTQSGLAYVVGDQVRAVSNGTPANWMEGQVTAYSGTSLTVNVALANGSGTDSDWNLSVAGVQGPSGAPGVAGATGPQGPAGATGATGATGPAGPQGSIGLTGATGPQGPIGLTGPQGAVGPSGPLGPQGPQGQQGLQGAMGPIGPIGPAGPTGPNGAAGQGFNFRNAYVSGTQYAAYDVVTESGSTYEAMQSNQNADPASDVAANVGNWALMAQAGTAGPQGAAGATGPAGPQGSTGLTGATGPQGPIGLTGAPGATGPQGQQGLQGPVGMTWQRTFNANSAYNVNDAVAYNGSSYIALNSLQANQNNPTPDTDSTDWQMLAQMGAAGAIGPQGPQGGVGATGPIGPQGPIGLTGATGAAGANGATGPMGPQGPIGLTGPQGATGATGTFGAGVNDPQAPYTALPGDNGKLITMSGGTGMTVTLPDPATLSPTWYAGIQNLNASNNLTVTSAANINGANTAITLLPYQIVQVWTDRTSYYTTPALVAGANITLTPSSIGSRFQSLLIWLPPAPRAAT